jgi:hypothetical protein
VTAAAAHGIFCWLLFFGGDVGEVYGAGFVGTSRGFGAGGFVVMGRGVGAVIVIGSGRSIGAGGCVNVGGSVGKGGLVSVNVGGFSCIYGVEGVSPIYLLL